MKYLLDTHVFLWMALASQRLSPHARATIEDTANALFFSAASAWEIGIKTRLGKLTLPGDAIVYVPARIAAFGLTELPISVAHSLGVERLPAHHEDPFDRLLVAQAQIEGLTIITADPAFSAYPVRLLRA